MSRGWFAILHLCWAGVIHSFFMVRLFGRLQLPGTEGPLSPAVSRRLLLIIVALCMAAGFLSALKHERNRWRIALNVLTPYGLYLALKTAAQDPVCLWIAVLIWASATLFYAAVLFLAPIHSKKNRTFVLEVRACQLASASWLLSRTMLCLLVAAAMVSTVFGLAIVRPLETGDRIAIAEESGAEEQLQGLREDRWAGLSLQERVELMQRTTDIETNYLGLPDTLRVNCLNMPPDTLGLYVHDVRVVCISRDHLLYDPPEECLSTILHEVYHSYQYHLCALYEDADAAYRSLVFLRPARDYIDEFEHYHDGAGDYMAYYAQACEYDAREYAKDRCAVYQQMLDPQGG